jgi:hypothetical protein
LSKPGQSKPTGRPRLEIVPVHEQENWHIIAFQWAILRAFSHAGAEPTQQRRFVAGMERVRASRKASGVVSLSTLTGWQLAPALHAAQLPFGHRTCTQGGGEQICGGNHILDCEVDSHTADRGHRMRGVTDAEKARTIPLWWSVHMDGEEADRLSPSSPAMT